MGDRQTLLSLSSSRLAALKKKVLSKGSVQSVGQFVKVFRSIVLEDTDSEKKEVQVTVKDSALYEEVMLFGIKEVPDCFSSWVVQGQDGRRAKNKKAEVVMKTYLATLVKWLESLHEADMLKFVYQNAYPLVEPLLTYPVLFKKFSKSLLEHWGSSSEMTLKLRAFLLIKEIASKADRPTLDSLLKRMYLSFIANCKHMGWRNYEQTTFMINCYKEMLRIDPDAVYYTGFNFIREIAVLLKGLMASKNQDNIHKMYNWQLVNTLRLWTRLSLDHPLMADLVYPIVQVIQGLLDLFFTSKYFPLMLHLIALLNEIADVKGIQVGCSRVLLKMLSISEFTKRHQNANSKPFEFELAVKVQKQYLHSNKFWNQLFHRICQEVTLSVGVQQQRVFMPESTFYLVKELRNLRRKVKFLFYKARLADLIRLLESHAQEVCKARGSLSDTPSSLKDSLLPLPPSPLLKQVQAISKERQDQVKLKLTAEKDEDIEVKEQDEGLDYEPMDEDLSLEEDSEEDPEDEEALDRELSKYDREEEEESE